MTTPSDLMRYFAELAPAGRRNNINRAPAAADFVMIDRRRIEPEPVPAPPRVSPPTPLTGTPGPDRLAAAVEFQQALVPPTRTMRWTVWRTPQLDRLLAVERLHAHEHLLRMGWLFVTGTTLVDDEVQKVWFPLAEAPARLLRLDEDRFSLTIDSEFAMPGSIFDLNVRDAMEEDLLEMAARVFRSRQSMTNFNPAADPYAVAWINEALRHLAMSPPDIAEPDLSPMSPGEGLWVSPAIGVFTSRNVVAPNLSGTLLAWAARETQSTAFAAMYGLGRRTRPARSATPDVQSPMPLNGRQRDAVLAARHQDVTVISGPPGTGKTHVAAAIAIDTVAQGGSVLVCAQSDHAIEALVELFARHPGPRWLRFGSRHHLDRVAEELSAGRPAARSDVGVRTHETSLKTARGEAEEIRRQAESRLQAEIDFAAALTTRDRLGWAASLPAGLDPTAVDWDQCVTDLEVLAAGGSGLGDWYRKRRARRRIVSRFGGGTLADLAGLDDVVALGRAEAVVAGLVQRGGVTAADVLSDLEQADVDMRRREGEAIAYRREAAAGDLRDGGRAVANLATALRAGAAARRRLLRATEAREFLRLLPLWVGTLGEVDDTLPMEPGMFDLVVLDEASQINQVRAAAALARGVRCVVVGDPKQLRHVSFVSDASMREAAAHHQLETSHGATADVRRNSIFDVAAGASAVVELDEHFRSVPHIIGFSNRNFYSGRLRLMTVHPSNERSDAIDVVVVPGTRNSDGVNVVEVEAALDLARRVISETNRSSTIGIVSPFRAQADAVEEMILDTFDVETIEQCGLRVGTVHGFQGAERDVTLLTLGIDADAGAQHLRFLQDPNLFNVMVTRARRLVMLITSVDDRDALPEGLLRAYLRHADRPPRPAERAEPPRGWVASLAGRIEGYGIRVLADYPVAGYTVDLAVGEGNAAVGVECLIHPDGPAAHIERHLALRRAGWDILDAFESRFLARPDAAVEQIVEAVLRRRRSQGPPGH